MLNEYLVACLQVDVDEEESLFVLAVRKQQKCFTILFLSFSVQI